MRVTCDECNTTTCARCTRGVHAPTSLTSMTAVSRAWNAFVSGRILLLLTSSRNLVEQPAGKSRSRRDRHRVQRERQRGDVATRNRFHVGDARLHTSFVVL